MAKDAPTRSALVTGATRGVGLGVARVLVERGFRVVVTGRTATGQHSDGAQGSLESAREALGEAIVPVQCDHFDPEANRTLMRTIQADLGPLDVLVNNAWAGYEGDGGVAFDKPFWQQPLDGWDRMFLSLRAQFDVTGQAIHQGVLGRGGLVVNVGSDLGGDCYLGSVPYDTVKTAVRRLTYGMAMEARAEGIDVVGVMPGFTRTERVLAADLPGSELERTHSPEFVGRGVAALAAEADRSRWVARMADVTDLAEAYGFTDTDGRHIQRFVLQPGEDKFEGEPPSRFR